MKIKHLIRCKDIDSIMGVTGKELKEQPIYKPEDPSFGNKYHFKDLVTVVGGDVIEASEMNKRGYMIVDGKVWRKHTIRIYYKGNPAYLYYSNEMIFRSKLDRLEEALKEEDVWIDVSN